MSNLDEAAYQTRLKAILADLDAAEETNADARSTVELDQQSVGRLSRMDALQQQAMANATAQRRLQERRAILAALKRLDEGEFGYCAECGEEIAPKRLELNPTALRCVKCAS